jgi:hypothetical protein
MKISLTILAIFVIAQSIVALRSEVSNDIKTWKPIPYSPNHVIAAETPESFRGKRSLVTSESKESHDGNNENQFNKRFCDDGPLSCPW